MQLKFIFIVISFVFFGLQSLNAQSHDWSKVNKGSVSNYDDNGYSVITDDSGNVYTTGNFYETVDFDPNAGTNELTSLGDDDIYVQKLDSAGNLVWAKSMGDYGHDCGRSIALDDSGNVYITGYFQNTVDFDPGPNVFNLTSEGVDDIFLCKLDVSGSFVWAIQMGGASFDRGFSVKLDTLGNVYTTGYFTNTVDFDPDTTNYEFSSNGGADVFVSKFDNSGSFLWSKQVGGTNDDNGYSMELSESGKVYIIGSFRGTVDFDPGPGNYDLTTIGYEDSFILKLNRFGEFIWVKIFGGSSSPGKDKGRSITLDRYENVYVTGPFIDTSDFDPGMNTYNLYSEGYRDVFISKLDSSGIFKWARSFGGKGYDNGNSVSVDETGNVYIAGYFSDTVDFDPGIDTFNLVSISANDYDGFVCKLDSLGNFEWVQQIGSSDDNKCNDILVGSSGHLYTTGFFTFTVDFDPGLDTVNLTSGSFYGDIFVYKMFPCNPVIHVDTIVTCDSYTWIDGNTYTQSNTSAMHTYPDGAVNGCDSIVYLDLTLTNKSTDVKMACDTLTWIDGNLYSTSNNTATHIYPGASINGCDSIVELNLTISSSNTTTDIISSCDSYTWIDGNTYTMSNNSATYTFTNQAGCDSIVSLDLTLDQSNSSVDVQTACDSYTWINGNTYTSDNNIATDTLTTATGCDSIVTLDLTIISSSTGTDVKTVCDWYTWIDGNTYTSSNSTAMHTLTNAAGCDSVVTLDLTINSVSDITTTTSGTTITSNNTGASYQWLDCDNTYSIMSGETDESFTPTLNGNYAVELTENGCVDTSNCVSISTVGILENNFGDTLSVYPNPTDGDFSIDLADIYENTQISITDISGRIIHSKTITQAQIIPLSLEDSPGIYMVTIIAGEKRAVIRLIKE